MGGEGTPQGGVISPLLANIALHGLESMLRESLSQLPQGQREAKPIVVRYADDFVVMHPDLAVIERAQQTANEWLAGMGLELNPSKTRTTHTLNWHNEKCGFDFLGFAVRQYPVGKTHSGKLGGMSGRRLGFKTIIKPSKVALRRHSRTLGDVIHAHKARYSIHTSAQPMYEWNTLPWPTFQRRVFKLQKRIYQASRRGEVKAVHRLQRLLMKSWAARCLAVRRVTQDNRGKTPCCPG